MSIRTRLRDAWDVALGRASASRSSLKSETVASGAEWGSAGKPLQVIPTHGDYGVEARGTGLETPVQFEYPQGINLLGQPRSGFGLLSFVQLRSLADLCQEIRLPLELLKREVRALEWQIVGEGDVSGARAWLTQPDGMTLFDSWVNTVLEELLVTDAVALYPGLTRGGQITGLEVIDGATIRPLLDARGATPKPPLPAYAQILGGLAVGHWTREQLWYLPFNKRIHAPYGAPPVELVVFTVNTALRRAQGRLGQYTEGNVPEALVGLPADWKIQDIQAFQDYWDALLSADQQRLQKMKFLPVSGSGALPVHEFQRSDGQTVVLDEWLLRVGCWAVGVTPAEFGLVPGAGLGGTGFSQTQAEIMHRTGLGPVAQYLKQIFDLALLRRGFVNTEFTWVTLTPMRDKLQQAQVDEIYLRNGVYSLQYVQERENIPETQRPTAPPDWAEIPAASEVAATEFFRGADEGAEDGGAYP